MVFVLLIPEDIYSSVVPKETATDRSWQTTYGLYISSRNLQFAIARRANATRRNNYTLGRQGFPKNNFPSIFVQCMRFELSEFEEGKYLIVILGALRNAKA